MDTSFMNFHGVEHFSIDSYFTDHSETGSNLFDDASNQSNNNFAWDWQNDRNIADDMDLLQNTATLDYCKLSTSPYNKDDVNKMLHDWQQFINVEDGSEDLNIDFNTLDDKNDLYKEPLPDIIDNIDEQNFDITAYVNQQEPSKEIHSVGPGGKKIDMLAQRYVINDSEDDHIDVETVSEHPSPVLEACDVNSLFEQFEAETKYNIELDNIKSSNENCSIIKDEVFGFDSFDNDNSILAVKQELKDENIQKASLHTSTQLPTAIESEPASTSSIGIKTDLLNINEKKTLCNDGNDRHKQIIESLPQELINRIKQSSKRKPIAVIPAKPTRKRGRQPIVQENKQKPIKQETIQPEQLNKNAKIVAENNDAIKLEEESLLKRRKNITTDHDYCIVTSVYPKQPLKDSGFESAEEDDKYNIIKTQPTYRSSDGKMMVSILKSNTIRNNISNTSSGNGKAIMQKKKLNLEEYKKRRDISFKNSASNSPLSSGRNSPQVVEDEHTKRLKHQELLMKMASAILKPIKKENKADLVLPELPIIVAPNATSVATATTTDAKPSPTVVVKQEQRQPRELKPPPNLQMKTIVSIGTNTDESWSQLKDISPILQNINVKIDSNSLIASVIENIPKVKTNVETTQPQAEHGEDKTIIFIDKNRRRATTCNVYVQTDFNGYKNELIEYKTRRSGRRRNSSTSSRSSSSSSTSSLSSSSSSFSSSSRSRSTSPVINTKTKHKKSNIDYERIREVEERRVVYVGGISDDTTREDLKQRFQVFGPITNVSVHFRNVGDNYGFVTFIHKLDAYEAVEHGNEDPDLPRYDLSFGGRRMFCKTNYADLDNVRDEINYFSPQREEDSFDSLLREFQAKIRRRKF